MVRGIVDQFVDMRCPDDKHPDTWDVATLRNDVLTQFGVKIDTNEFSDATRNELSDHVFERLKDRYQEKEDLVGADVMRHTERIIMLQVIDTQWKDHLMSLDELRQGIGHRAQAQKDPLVEYKKESYTLFEAMMDRIEDETVRYLYFLQVSPGGPPPVPYPSDEDEEAEDAPPARPEANDRERQAAKSSMEDFTRNIQRRKEKELAQLHLGGDGSDGNKQVLAGQKVGRNEPCPCGSGKKYKKCHGS